MENQKEYLNGITKWLKEVKGITEIDAIELVEMMPEYDEYVSNLKQLEP